MYDRANCVKGKTAARYAIMQKQKKVKGLSVRSM